MAIYQLVSEPGFLLYFSLLLLDFKFSPYWHYEITASVPPAPLRVFMADVFSSSQRSFLMSSALALEADTHFQLEVACEMKLWGSTCPWLMVFPAVLSHLPKQDTQSFLVLGNHPLTLTSIQTCILKSGSR